MVLLKSILAGLVFLAGAAILLLLGTIVYFATVLAPEAGTAIAFDPVSIAKSSPLLWVLAVLVFLLGFSWECRRAKARQAA
jgi:ABC-type Na+ efflux pump permease subunit